MRRIFNTVGILLLAGVVLAPQTSSAACVGKLCTLVASAASLIDILIGLVASLALLVFFWGLVKYILKAGDEKAKEEGKRIMVGGVIALFVLFSVFGIIRFAREALGVVDERNITPPRVVPYQ